MNHLLRELAPVPETAWAEIDAEAARTLRHFLTARRIVDIDGPSAGRRLLSRADAPRNSPTRPPAPPRTCARSNRSSSTAPSSGSSAPSSMRSTAARSTPTSMRCATPRADSHSPKTARCSTGTRPQGSKASPRQRRTTRLPIDDDYRRLSRHRRGRRGRAADRRGRGAVRDRARTALLHGCDRDHGDGRLPAARAPSPDLRRSVALGARRRRRGR